MFAAARFFGQLVPPDEDDDLKLAFCDFRKEAIVPVPIVSVLYVSQICPQYSDGSPCPVQFGRHQGICMAGRPTCGVRQHGDAQQSCAVGLVGWASCLGLALLTPLLHWAPAYCSALAHCS